nr:hypothetical protein [Cellulomonas sp. URHE0023]
MDWEYLDGDSEIARRVVSILEDRRMLWLEYAWETPSECADSASRTRTELTAQINTLGIGRDLAQTLKEIRSLFADYMTDMPRLDFNGLEVALGVLRRGVGERLAVIVSKYQLDVDERLATIIPDQGNWFFEWVGGA